MIEEEIRVLAVRQPYAYSMVSGLKTVEVRSRPTKIRERVAIYASTTHPSQKEFIEVRQNLALTFLDNPKYDPTEELHTGKIIGSVEIVGCRKPENGFEYALYTDEHFAPIKYYKEDKTYFWDLRRPIKFEAPIPFEWPSTGAWAKTVLPEGY